ncbi:DUF4326 domain-containing protein [Carbonactinospora thermoautotrophica]|uniref:DUF4326 domain-containing protein n=1 Tax=Carbonactinospora thermoautotrophica TaxID=1469144 RepID=UPI00099F2518|nr:DUF4326 domain-containing protein [Carbonactinospora thermoautotrophica]
MPTPSRIQHRPGVPLPEGAVYVGQGTRWASPITWPPGVTPTNEQREAVVRAYTQWLSQQPNLLAAAREELAGRDLACDCPLGVPCHADYLLHVANSAPLDRPSVALRLLADVLERIEGTS